MSAIENEPDQCLTQRGLIRSLQGLWLSLFLRDWPVLWGEGPGEPIALDSPDWVRRSNTSFAPPPWSWEGAWLPAVIQAPPDLGALPLTEGWREGASLVRCKTRPGFLPTPPHPFQGPTSQLFRRTSRPPQAPTCESATNTLLRLCFGKPPAKTTCFDCLPCD